MKADESSQSDWVREAMNQHAGPLTRYAAVILDDVERARDVVQDTFVRLCAAERRSVEPHLAEWLFTVCRHRALDVLRKENRMQPMSETDLDHPSAEDCPASHAERLDTHSHVLRQLARLPRNQQEVVRLKFQNGLSYEEISRVTSLSVSNVGFLIHTALKTLRQRLHAEMQYPPKETRHETHPG